MNVHVYIQYTWTIIIKGSIKFKMVPSHHSHRPQVPESPEANKFDMWRKKCYLSPEQTRGPSHSAKKCEPILVYS